MKDIFLLLLLLSVHADQASSETYQADSNGSCHETHYKLEKTDLCCKKCQPGYRHKKHCSVDSETWCEPCPSGQYMERMNYSPNCVSCKKCKSGKGLQYIQNCSTTTMSKCGCQPGMYCIMDFEDPYCALCSKYTLCKAGYGVSEKGTASSNVKCERCPNGTFSDTVSSTDPCRPHTKCNGRVVIREGNATADTVCQPFVSNIRPKPTTKEPHVENGFPSTSPTMMTTDFVLQTTINFSVSSISSLPLPHTAETQNEQASSSLLVAPIAGVVGGLILLIVIVVLIRWKATGDKGGGRRHPKTDANGNCDTSDEISNNCTRKSQMISFRASSNEEECLLKEGEACSSRSQSSNNTDLSNRTDDCSSYDSIGPLQSTIGLHSPRSALSEPMTLQSHTESASFQTSIPTQPPSQPTSPNIISPITTSPHVNVNITFNIGNGSDGTQCVTPTSLVQSDSQLPFGEKEETFNIPLQEAGKQAAVAVQESTGFSV